MTVRLVCSMGRIALVVDPRSDPTFNLTSLMSLKFLRMRKTVNMAANGARRALQLSSSTGKILLGRSSAASSCSKVGKSSGISFGNVSSSSSSSRYSLRRLTSSRVPVELSAVISILPLHSVTASALLTSLLSLSNLSWGCLSEGFATTL